LGRGWPISVFQGLMNEESLAHLGMSRQKTNFTTFCTSVCFQFQRNGSTAFTCSLSQDNVFSLVVLDGLYKYTAISRACLCNYDIYAERYVASNGWMAKNNALLLVCKKEVMTWSKVFYRDTLCQIRTLSVPNTNRERDLLSQVAPRVPAWEASAGRPAFMMTCSVLGAVVSSLVCELVRILVPLRGKKGVRGGVVCWGTVLQAGRSRVRF
jgi:hypothetical protein